MKTPLISLTLLLIGTAMGTADAATTGNLRFEGLITTGTCNLAAGDVDRVIKLDTAKVADFDSQTYAKQQPFDLTANCDSSIKTVMFSFSGTPSPEESYRFLNTGTAKGIALWLVGVDGKTIGADGTNGVQTIATVNGVAIVPLKAAYWKLGTVTAGTLESLITVNVTYN